MICVSLSKMDFETCLAWTEKADALELRLDLLDPLSPEQMQAITTSGAQWIATCRPGSMDEETRYACLSQAIVCGATFVDVEYEAGKEYREALMHTARQFSCNIIMSYHNTENTPDAAALKHLVRECFNRGADYVKVVTTVQSEADEATVLGLYDHFDQLMAFGMGEHSRALRIKAAPKSVFTYVAPDAEHLTAPGQISWQEALDLQLDRSDENQD